MLHKFNLVSFLFHKDSCQIYWAYVTAPFSGGNKRKKCHSFALCYPDFQELLSWRLLQHVTNIAVSTDNDPTWKSDSMTRANSCCTFCCGIHQHFITREILTSWYKFFHILQNWAKNVNIKSGCRNACSCKFCVIDVCAVLQIFWSWFSVFWRHRKNNMESISWQLARLMSSLAPILFVILFLSPANEHS